MKGDDIADRLMGLAVACLRFAAALEASAVEKHVGRQLTRSATSGGANYEEARSAESAGDFAHKIAVAAKEVGETVYWLRLAQHAGLSDTTNLTPWINEGRQLVRILEACARTARGRRP